MFLVSACSCLCAIYLSRVLSRDRRCSWSSADRRCSDYIRVINNLIAYLSASYFRDLTVRSNDIHLMAISQEIPQPSVTKISLRITFLKLHSNELMWKIMQQNVAWLHVFKVTLWQSVGSNALLPSTQLKINFIEKQYTIFLLVVPQWLLGEHAPMLNMLHT